MSDGLLQVFCPLFSGLKLLTNESISAIVCRLTILISFERRSHTVRERQKELSRRRKRKEETLRAKRKAAKTEGAARKGK